MSDDTPASRDSSGRFVRRAAEKAHAMSMTSNEGVHPMAKVLFGWTEAKHIGAIIFWGMAILSFALILVDVFVVRHEKLEFANATGFYGLWGFGAFTFVVLMGWPLGHLLRRDENYYGDASGPPADIDPDVAARLANEKPDLYEGDE